MGGRRVNSVLRGRADGTERAQPPTRPPAPMPAVLALQRSYGNRAVAALLQARAGPAAVPVAVQRYVPVNGAGVMSPTIVTSRSAGGEAGFMSAANMGWILIGTAAADQPQHIERSVRPTPGTPGSGQHTEERLVAWALAQGANLALDPTDASGTLRVKAMYSERQPCTLADTDDDRKARPHGCCDAYLTAVLHAAVPVYYSVGGPAPHANMLRTEKAKYIRRRQIGRVHTEMAARRAVVDWHPELGNLVRTAITTIRRLAQPRSDNEYDVFKAAAIAAANAGIAAIRAWNPPLPALDLGRPPSPPGPPPGPPDAGPSGKRSLASSTGTDKRRRVSTT
jgi:hypothetical protein